jgi:hypothetical protein
MDTRSSRLINWSEPSMPHFIQMLTVDDKENHSRDQRAYDDFNRDAAVQARRRKLSFSLATGCLPLVPKFIGAFRFIEHGEKL